MPAVQNQYKDRLFNFIFGSEGHKDWTLSFYNAVNGTEYSIMQNDPHVWRCRAVVGEAVFP